MHYIYKHAESNYQAVVRLQGDKLDSYSCTLDDATKWVIESVSMMLPDGLQAQPTVNGVPCVTT